MKNSRSRWGMYTGRREDRDVRQSTRPLERSSVYVTCPHCHRLTHAGTGFCSHCGMPLSGVVGFNVPKDYKWDIPVGVDPAGNPAGIKLSDLQAHLVVYGIVGSGKTTFVKHVLREVVQSSANTRFIVVDWEGEYIDLAEITGARVLSTGEHGEPLRISLFDPGNTPLSSMFRGLRACYCRL